MTAFATYTPNPTIDVWGEVERIYPTEKMRSTGVRHDPGGGGINVARMLHELGSSVVAVHWSGGATRSLFEALLERSGLPARPVPIAGDTRICQILRERETGHEFRVVPDGPQATQAACDAGLAVLADVPADWIVASGSLPPGAPVDHYARVAELARRRGCRFAIDCAGAPIRAVLASGSVDIVKVSRSELAHLVARPLETAAAVDDAALAVLRTTQVARILVSLGPDGALLADSAGLHRVATPPATVVSTVGAGDSFLAGFLHALARGEEPASALAIAVAVGTAACLRPGTQLAERADVERLRQEMRL
ncbi:MAG: 1-phosphofructokinase family hexose kinase [Burkholderiales bacterium]|nr:1-phosphofructokinase family hexose kinase [Burkholderiales bacterium]